LELGVKEVNLYYTEVIHLWIWEGVGKKGEGNATKRRAKRFPPGRSLFKEKRHTGLYCPGGRQRQQ